MKTAQTLALGLLLAAGLAIADDERTQAEQRVRLAARLIADSPAAQRIQASGNAVAISHLDEGRLHLSTAEEALKAGDAAKARKSAEEVLGQIQDADVVESASKLTLAQTAFEASLQVTLRALNLSIVDFI